MVTDGAHTGTFTEAEVADLSARLASFDDRFTPEERLLVRGLLVRGVAAVREEAGAEVSGFALLLPAINAVREAPRSSSSSGVGAFVLAGHEATHIVQHNQTTLDFLHR